MDDLNALRTALNGADPAKDTAPTPQARQWARTNAILRLKENTPMVRPLWRRIPVLAAGAVTAALAVGATAMLLPGGDPLGVPAAYAAPPEPIEVVGGEPTDGTGRLLALADTAEGRGDAEGEGEVGFVSSTGTTLYRLTANAGEDDPEETHGYGFIPFEWNEWQDLEGNMRRDEHPQPPLETGGREADHEWFLEQQTDIHEEELDPTLVWPDELPTDTAGMTDLLSDFGADPVDDSLANLVNSVENLYDSRPLSGAEEAAVQRMIAESGGVEYLGTATDPLDREGDLFRVRVEDEVSVAEHRYLYDPQDGSLLYRDTTLLEEDSSQTQAEEFGLAYPLLSEQVSYLWSGWVQEVGQRP
ncbi:CU044_5270 family protein [Nocardiopsis lucentensis]|uniref:CU044_5270 family protein n=1 Tax=Nocardiopsis lucentensis TaxID=53441 RepID=UPI0003453158|nr:CU044_5270 family protein [Nocardiopsis lucentensis]